jgi:outer membrane protein assembly factor BamB
MVPAAAADWPHVRGPGYDARSTETGLVNGWGEAGPPVLWTRELGPGYSAFIVAGERAFTLFQTSGGMFLIALDAATGAEFWKERVDWPWQPGGMYPGPYASPTWFEGKVYYATPTGIVGCRRAEDGRSLWSVNVRERFGGGKGTEFGFASTPAVEGGRVYLPVGGPGAAMVALNADDGATLWAAGDDPASYCPAYPITLDGRRRVVGFLQNSLAVFDAESGTRVWRERVSSSYDEHSAWPLFDGERLMIASPFRVGAQTFRFTTTRPGIAATPGWGGRQLSNDVCSSLLHDGYVYGFDIQQLQASTHRASKGAFKCLEFATGNARWETADVGQASPLLADGKLILWTETGTLILAKASPEGYAELARARVLDGGGMCWAAPALSGKRLIVRNQKRAVCLYLGPPTDLDPNRPVHSLPGACGGFDWTRLAPKEPDFPNDAPVAGEIALWFASSIGILAVAAVAGVLLGRTGLRRKAGPMSTGIAFLLGAVGTTVAGARFDAFVLTWPVSLYVAFRVVLGVGLDRTAQGWRHRLAGRTALLLFVALCYGYYRLCIAIGYAAAWGFLAGFLPALPFAVLAQRAEGRTLRWVWECSAFVAFFWTSGLLPRWKDSLTE